MFMFKLSRNSRPVCDAVDGCQDRIWKHGVRLLTAVSYDTAQTTAKKVTFTSPSPPKMLADHQRMVLVDNQGPDHSVSGGKRSFWSTSERPWHVHVSRSCGVRSSFGGSRLVQSYDDVVKLLQSQVRLEINYFKARKGIFRFQIFYLNLPCTFCVSQVIFFIFIKILMLLLSKLKADQVKFTDYRYRYSKINE